MRWAAAYGSARWQPAKPAGPCRWPDQPAGLYLVQLLAPAATPLTWKLLKQ